MKLLVFSDTHGDKVAVSRLLARLDDYDYAFFLGDGLGDVEEYTQLYLNKMLCVRGNCDYDYIDRAEEITVTLGGIKILATHGYRYHVKRDLSTLQYHAHSMGVNLVLFGHTHIPYRGYGYGGMLLLNPGSVGGGSQCGTYAEVEIKDGNIFAFLQKIPCDIVDNIDTRC